MPTTVPKSSFMRDQSQRSPTADGDLGLFGFISPNPNSSETLDQHVKPLSVAPSSNDAHHSTFSMPKSSSLAKLAKIPSSSSLVSNYFSADEDAVSTVQSHDSQAAPNHHFTPRSESEAKSRSLPPVSPSNKQALSTPKFKQAMSVEDELQLSPSLDLTPLANEPRPRREFDTSSGLPNPEERLPLNARGPTAPLRRASIRLDSRRSSNAGSSNNGHGDLGSGSIPGLSGQMSFIGSPLIATSFPSTASRRASISSNLARIVPHRRGSLSTSTSTTSSRLSSPTKAASSSTTPLSSSSSPSHEANVRLGIQPKPIPFKPSPSSPQLDREAMQRWVLSVGCVNFDLELGPDLEFLYPPLGISREERDNIAFSSFPDTSIFDDGSSVFSWRVREVPLDSSNSEPPTIPGLTSGVPTDKSSQVESDDKTPRASFNKSGTQTPDPSSEQLKATLSSSKHHATSCDSSTLSRGPSRQGSEANLPTSTHSGISFHERLSQKLFHGHSSSDNSTSSSMSRSKTHDRKPSGHSSSSSPSAENGPELLAHSQKENNKTSKVTAPKRAGNSTSSSYIYGYVFFRQKRDPTNRRGYFQKSVVILSHLPYVGLFSQVVARLGPLYFEHGMTMFEAFANDVCHWPSPQPGSVLTLPLLGTILTAAIPFGQQAQNSPNADSFSAAFAGASITKQHATMSIRHRARPAQGNRELPEPLIGPEGPLLASIPATSLFDSFKEALSDLWLLWECVLLAEPILVIAPDPKAASEAIWHLLDLIRPIPYAGDFRPYFHIHDYDFRTLVTKNKPQAGTLIGATNPFFVQTCSHWPHVLRVGRAAVKSGTAFKHGHSGANQAKKNGVVRPLAANVGGGHGAGGGGPDHLPGFLTKRKRRISKDRTLLKKLQEIASSEKKATASHGIEGYEDDFSSSMTNAAANVMMRRYFADLTERFLAPLNRYVASLVPADFDLSSPSEAPKIKPFNTTAFLASLKAHGTPLAIRSRSLPTGAAVRQSLYLDFLKCPNFSLWLHSRVAAAEEEQRRRYIAALVQGDVTTFGHTRGEIETIDLYSRLVEEIRLVDVQLTSPTEPGPGSRWRTDRPSASIPIANLPKPSASSTSTSFGRSTLTHLIQGSTTEKRLLEQKARLMDQLDKLCLTLPDDLRKSLRRPE